MLVKNGTGLANGQQSLMSVDHWLIGKRDDKMELAVGCREVWRDNEPNSAYTLTS